MLEVLGSNLAIVRLLFFIQIYFSCNIVMRGESLGRRGLVLKSFKLWKKIVFFS